MTTDNTCIFSMPEVTPDTLNQAAIAFYRTQGFVRVRGLLAPDEAAEFYAASLAMNDCVEPLGGQVKQSPIFQQRVNVWRDDETLKTLTLHPRIARVAERLAGVPLRIWHDQSLIKLPHNNAATEFHQDQPYWPHAGSANPISCWIALCDVPVEKGCMTFLPGTQERTDLEMQNLSDGKSLFSKAPDLEWQERVTVPLKQGDCTFHHGRCAHMATPNFTDDPRVAHVVIFMDAATTYTGLGHLLTDPLNIEVGAPLEGELFPSVADYA